MLYFTATAFAITQGVIMFAQAPSWRLAVESAAFSMVIIAAIWAKP